MSACSSPQAPAAPHDSGPTACAEGTPGCIGWVNCPPDFEKEISLEGVSVHEVLHGGLVARSKGTITAKDTVVHGTTPGADGVFGMGVWSDSGATLLLENTAVVDNSYYGVSVVGASSSAIAEERPHPWDRRTEDLR